MTPSERERRIEAATGALRFLWLREAIASTALSHHEGCRCLTCRAWLGDEAAMAELLAELDEAEVLPRSVSPEEEV